MSIETKGLPGPPPVITVQGLSGEIAEGNGRRRSLFQAVDFRLESRRLLAITGRNGIGKTSLLRLLAGLETAVEFQGSAMTAEGPVPIERLSTLYKAWLAENGHEVFPGLRVRENLEMVLLATRQRWSQETDSFIQQWKLEKLLPRLAFDLSVGELRRVQILMAILSQANAIFLDEPLSGLDDAGIASFHELLDDVLRNEVIVVLTEHHIESLGDLEIEHLTLLEPPFA